jgi:hypothetical protein
MPNDVQISELTKVTETPNSSDLLLIRHGTVDSKIEYKDLKAAITTNTLFVNPNGVVTQASNPYYNKSEVNNLISGLQGQIDTLNSKMQTNTAKISGDLNDINESGIYNYPVNTNDAPTTNSGSAIVLSNNAGSQKMFLAAPANVKKIFFRYLVPQGLTEWNEIPKQSEVDALNSSKGIIPLQRFNDTNISYNDIYPEENMKVQIYAVGNLVQDRPRDGVWFILLASRAESTYITQFAIGMTGTFVYYRRFTIGNPVAWNQIL